MALFASALAQANALEEEENVGPDDEPVLQAASGILPQLGVFLRLPEDIRLYDPEGPRPADEDAEKG